MTCARLNQTESSPRRRLLRQVFWLALLHYLSLQCLAGVIFLAVHTPPRAVNLDGLISFLVRIEDVLVFPRWLALRLWPFEYTPPGMGIALAVWNSAVWGGTLAALRNFWRHATR